MALGLPDVRVGTWTHPEVPTGCTVILPPDGTVGAIAVRGSAPGTREAAALGPFGKVAVCHAVVLSGGSAYGLATADGVMRWLEEHGVGYETRVARVPIVGAAIVLDIGVAFASARPDAAAGRAACEAAVPDEPVEGAVGAAAGTSVAKVGGIEHAWRGGQGVAVHRVGDLVVGALVVNNGVGEVVAEDGTLLAASRAPTGTPRYPLERDSIVEDSGTATSVPDPHGAGPTDNTVIGCVVTNARLDKLSTHRVADLAHSGIARALRPAHTIFDGDALFALATGVVDAPLDRVTALAADAVAEAVRRGPLAATDLGPVEGLLPGGVAFAGLPGLAGVSSAGGADAP